MGDILLPQSYMLSQTVKLMEDHFSELGINIADFFLFLEYNAVLKVTADQLQIIRVVNEAAMEWDEILNLYKLNLKNDLINYTSKLTLKLEALISDYNKNKVG